MFMREGESCASREWEEQSSGWVMTIVAPPPRFKSADEKEGKGRLVMYLHGGGFHFPMYVRLLDSIILFCAFATLELIHITRSSKFHWAYIGYLARELDSEVVVVPIPLCPQNDGPGIMSAMTGIWKSFNTLAAGRETIVVGDRCVPLLPSIIESFSHSHPYSSGGLMGLCLPFALHSHSSSSSSPPIQPPSQVVAISPPTTFTPHWDPAIMSLDLILRPASFDTLVRAWASVPIPPGVPPSSVPIPREVSANASINPMAGDFSLYKEQGIKLVVVSGTWDILHSDIKVLVAKAEMSGAEVTYIEGEHQFHAFSVAIDVAPECREASEKLVRTVIKNGLEVI